MADVSTIAAGTTIRGSISGDGDLDVLGRVEGSIHIRGELTIGDGALVKSDVSAARVVIRGAVAGDVVADESVVLEAGARVVGDLRAPRIGVRPGALVRGHVSTTGEAAAPKRSAAASHAARPAPAAARGAPPPAAARPRQAPTQAPVHASSSTSSASASNSGSNRSSSDGAAARPAASPPAPNLPSIRKGAKASLKRKSAREG